MQITVTEIVGVGFEEYRVTFQSSFGSMSAGWSGEVLDVREHYGDRNRGYANLGVDITVREDRGYHIFEKGERKYFWGWVEHINDNRLLMLKIGTSLLMISTAGKPLAQNGFVELKANNVAIYDEDL